MSSSRQRLPHAVSAPRLAVALGVLLLVGLAPASVQAASPAGGAGLQPTIHYEEALAHAHDKIAFKAGGRVSVPFRPRASDHWAVGGHAPRPLPAGRHSGAEMRTGNGPHEVPVKGVDASIDQPVVDPALRTDAATAVADPLTTAGDVDLAAAVSSGGLRREVFGFLPYWELSASSTRLDWDKISTVAFFGVGADGGGNLQKQDSDGSTTVGWSGWTSSRMTSVIDAAHSSGARVVLTVQSFAWSTSGLSRQKALLGSSAARSNLATQVVKAVRDRGADGVNLDFEPLASGYDGEFTALVRTIRSKLNAAASGYQLTFDTTGWIGNYPVEDATASGGADAIMIMGYDYRNAGSGVAGSIAPIDASIYDISDTLAAYLARVPASKLILGVPYYGRAWSTSGSGLHASNISGTKYGSSTTANYDTAYDFGVQHGRNYDATEGVSWTAYKRQTCTSTYGCVTAWRQLYWDDATALKAKYDLVNQRGLRGVGLWALGYDGTRPELYQAIADKFITDSVPPKISGSTLSSTAFSPNGDGRYESTTATLTASGLTTWGYLVQPWDGSSAGPAIRSGTQTGTKPSFTWNGRDPDGTRVPDGTYRVTVWTADASGNRSQRSFIVKVDTTPPTLATTTGYGFLTPDGDGHIDKIVLGWNAPSTVEGTVRIIDSGGTLRRKWTVTGHASSVASWDGRDVSGRIRPDGRFTYRVSVRDAVGNLRTVDKTIVLDRTLKAHTWSDYSFDPRAGQTSRLGITLRRSASVTATIYLGSAVARRVWSGKAFATGTHTWTWDGRTNTGAYAKPGTYRVRVDAKSIYGTTSWTRTVTVQVH